MHSCLQIILAYFHTIFKSLPSKILLFVRISAFSQCNILWRFNNYFDEKHEFSELWKSLQEIKFQDTGSLETYYLFNQTHSEVASIKCYLHDSHSDNQFWNYKSALTFWGLLEKVFIIFLNQKMNLFFNFICSLPLQVSLAASQIT